MATSKEYLTFILDQLSLLDGISYRMMMGEYIIYHHRKIAAYLCDDRLLVKILPSTIAILPDARREFPYEGAKEMLLVENIEDRGRCVYPMSAFFHLKRLLLVNGAWIGFG